MGTLAPIAYEAVTGAKISVGPPFFNAFYVPLGCAGGGVGAVTANNWEKYRLPSSAALLAGLGALLLALLLWFVLDPASLTVAGAVAMAARIVLSHGYDVFGGAKLCSAPTWHELGHLGLRRLHHRHRDHFDPIHRTGCTHGASGSGGVG
ncbi:MAG: hypothetical protein CM15mP120_25580 [Pseudomonadota bacterium]|nr:MAG: hypothetical protein CM15mP120_25580 [Pseudomonadota bacterium]